MKVAICFFGLTRSLSKTIDSIHTCIFKPLQHLECDIYLHTYKLYRLTNRRSGEHNCKLDPNEYKLLEPLKYIIDDQQQVDKLLQFNNYKTKGDPWRDGYASLHNLLRQFHSLHRVTTLWETSGIDYDVVIYCRPDVLFQIPINIAWLNELRDNQILVPSFLPCRGCNDRFAIGKPSVMKVYGHRLLQAREYSKSNKLHAESYLKNILVSSGITPKLVQFPFYRVRANGNISALDRQNAK